MHCLFVTSLLPEADPATGFEIANRAILEAFGAAGARLTIAGFRRPGGSEARPNEILLGEIPIENAAAGRRQKAAWVAKALAERLPVSAAKLRILSRATLMAKLDAAGPIDAVILNSIQMPTAYPFLLDLAPAIFVAHNVEHLSARQNAANARNTVERRLYAREARLLERAEREICLRAAVIHTLSAEDAGPLGLAGDTRCLPLPLSVDRGKRPDDGRRTHDVGLIGTWSWAPNRVGLDWFLEQVAPRLPADLTVAVAGSLEGRPDAPANVAFLGRVPDAQDFVSASRVMALATKGGTGVQLKTIETLEEGMPTVATSPALRGIGGALPANILVADDPATFAQALVDAVAAEKAGRLTRLDGSAFAARQKSAATEAAALGLRLVERLRQGAPDRPVRRIGPVDVLALRQDEALALCTDAIEAPGLTRLAFANAHCINLSRRDAAYRESLRDFAILPDGIGLDIASKLLHGRPFPTNLNGTDFVPLLLSRLERPCRVALIGGAEGIAERASAALLRLAPRHEYLPVSHGFFGEGEATGAVLDQLREARADIVLVALGVPRQELFIARHLTEEHARLGIGVGALFDFLAGRVPRAPPAVRRMRLEWGWRLAQEPRRLARRYLLGNPVFLAHALRQRFGRS